MHCDVCEEYIEDDHATHELRDHGYCLKIDGWFDDIVFENYDGEAAPLRSGPVILGWDGDWMTWSYDPADIEIRRQGADPLTQAVEEGKAWLAEHVGDEAAQQRLLDQTIEKLRREVGWHQAAPAVGTTREAYEQATADA